MARPSWLGPARRAAGITQQGLAHRIRKNDSYVSMLEAGHRRVRPELEQQLLAALAQGPDVPYVDPDDLNRRPKELADELAACREAMQVIGRAIGAGQGDRETLLSLLAAVVARARMIDRAVDLRLVAREARS
ncbi:MAG TPA: helix-turn-helix transcriptional regulator [Candidatus Polarisedimenticolia bacterium]|nr:helix-turn-helix transcriptional regulator [Candidatus Polarisedimenticolia bacterium]